MGYFLLEPRPRRWRSAFSAADLSSAGRSGAAATSVGPGSIEPIWCQDVAAHFGLSVLSNSKSITCMELNLQLACPSLRCLFEQAPRRCRRARCRRGTRRRLPFEQICAWLRTDGNTAWIASRSRVVALEASQPPSIRSFSVVPLAADPWRCRASA